MLLKERSVLKTQTSHQTSLDGCRRGQTSYYTSLDECRQVQTSHQTSLDECKRVQTSVNESKKIFFDISGGFPRWMFFNLRRFLPQKLRRMKLVLHCSKCTVVTRFFHLAFVRIQKEGILRTKLVSKMFFLSEQANFFSFRPTWKKFPTVQNAPEKRKNLYLNWPQNEKERLERGMRASQFFIFGI